MGQGQGQGQGQGGGAPAGYPRPQEVQRPAVPNPVVQPQAGKQQIPSFVEALALAQARDMCTGCEVSNCRATEASPDTAAAGTAGRRSRCGAFLQRWRSLSRDIILWAHDCGLCAGLHGPAGLWRAAHAGLRRRAPAGALQAHRAS